MMANSLLFLLPLFTSLLMISGDPIELSEIIIPEHTSINHLLVSLHSISPPHRRTSYRFVSSGNREIQDYFSLNSSTGELRITRDLDRETICPHRIQCKFALKIFELFNETLFHIPIIIEDINDHWPIFPYPTSSITLHISENSPPHQSKLYIEQAYDQDQLDNSQQLKYELDVDNSQREFPFRLETPLILSNELSSNRLALVLVHTLDRERIDSYNCTLRVSDTADHEAQLRIRIIVDDVNDQSPIFESEKYSVEVSENIPINTTLLRVHAVDADSGLNARVSYGFTDASKQYSNTFSIDNETGLIRLRSSLDYEQRSSYIFYIQARDSGNEPRSSQALVNITILDENDCIPTIIFRFLPELIYNPSKDLIEIPENYPIDKFFAQILVNDQDSGLGGQVRLWFQTIDTGSLTDNHDPSFHLYPIDNTTYFFNRSKPFDHEYQQWHRLIFYAQDLDPKQPLQTNRILTIRVLDENDNRPQFSRSFYHLSIDENNQKNITMMQFETHDPDSDENGRVTYEILTNETTFPFVIDPDSGLLRCIASLDREKQSRYDFEVQASDHGYPLALSSRVHVRIDVNDIDDNRPIFDSEQYEFTVSEDANRSQIIGSIRAQDADLNTRLIYRLESDERLFPFAINHRGEIWLKHSIDREVRDRYQFLAIAADSRHTTSVPITVKVLDINDCVPRWKSPRENNTILILNKDRVQLGTSIARLHAIDDDESSANGLINYSIVQIQPESIDFFTLTHDGQLLLNSTPNLGRFRLIVRAQDNGQTVRHSSVVQFDVLIGDNITNATVFLDTNEGIHFPYDHQLSSLSSTRRVLVLSTCFVGIAMILALIVCTVLILICRYRRQKYLYYIKCKAAQAVAANGHPSRDPTIMIVENRLTEIDEKNSSSNSSKLSLEDLHQKRLIDHSSSPSYTGANIYTQQHHQHHHHHHHPVSSVIKPTQATSDYYSNSSKHEEDVDEWTDEQHRTTADPNEWSIEKILYPDWLYKDSLETTTTMTTTTKKNLNTSTFLDFNSYRTFDGNTQSGMGSSSSGRRTMSSSLTSNSQPSPKQVRFGCPQASSPNDVDDQTRSYPHLSTTIRQLKNATAAVLRSDARDTFI